MEVVGWKAFYTLDRVFSSENSNWADLPSAGIVGVVVYYEKPYRDILTGGDWFYLEGECPDSTGTHDNFGDYVDPPSVPEDELKKGVMIPDDDFQKIRSRMTEDKEWP